MSTHRSRRIDRRTAEQLLRGAPDRVGPAGPHALSDLLAAASAPAHEGELAGEQAALAAFRSARLTPVPQPRRRSMLTTTLAKLVTVKIAGIAATAVAAGGIAVAAATGHLPAQKGDTPTVPPITSHAPGKPSTASTASTETSDAAEPKTSDSATPSPSLEGLCHAYTAGAGADHGKALDNPAFTFLITTAGGADKVPAYCAELLGDQPGKSTVTPPKGEPTHPDGRPTDVPNPSGPPSAHPTR